MRAEALAQVLQPLTNIFNPDHFTDLLIGIDAPDDAAAWRLEDGRVLVITTDFFTPVVDDPYDYGAIAAANSLSDVYAMGAKPFLALTIAALPPDLPVSISRVIMLGLAEKTAEAGAVIAGGHTVSDDEPKIGLVALGFVNENEILRKDALQIGDQLVLTKPLGFGVTTTALKQGYASESDTVEVVDWMSRLNRDAARLAVQFKLKAATDITGFSFLGHAWEMANAANVGLRVYSGKMPFITNAKEHAQAWRFPGGAFDNQHYYQEHVTFNPQLTESEQVLLFDPQTSGGLLLGVPEKSIEAFMAAAQAQQQPAWLIGEVVSGNRIDVV